MEALLTQHDWSSAVLDFQVALLALRNDEEGMVQALDLAIPARSITRQALEAWPLFKEFTKSARFTEIMRKYFPQA